MRQWAVTPGGFWMVRMDGSSRVPREAHWRGVIKSCESSGLSIVGYCREQGISVSKYHWWKSALKRRGVGPVVAPVFAEVLGSHPTEVAMSAAGGRPSDVRASSPGSSAADGAPAAAPGQFDGAPLLIELSLGGARRIGVRPGFDVETLSRVIALLERLGYAGGA